MNPSNGELLVTLGLIMVIIAIALFSKFMPKVKRSVRQMVPVPVRIPRTPTITPERVPTLTDKVKVHLLKVAVHQGQSRSARQIYRDFRGRKIAGDYSVRTLQVILEKLYHKGAVARRRPAVGSPRQRLHGTTYRLAA